MARPLRLAEVRRFFENNKTSAPFHGIGAVTVSGWVKASTNAAVNLLIKVYRGTSSNFYLTQQADGTLRFTVTPELQPILSPQPMMRSIWLGVNLST